MVRTIQQNQVLCFAFGQEAAVSCAQNEPGLNKSLGLNSWFVLQSRVRLKHEGEFDMRKALLLAVACLLSGAGFVGKAAAQDPFGASNRPIAEQEARKRQAKRRKAKQLKAQQAARQRQNRRRQAEQAARGRQKQRSRIVQDARRRQEFNRREAERNARWRQNRRGQTVRDARRRQEFNREQSVRAARQRQNWRANHNRWRERNARYRQWARQRRAERKARLRQQRRQAKIHRRRYDYIPRHRRSIPYFSAARYWEPFYTGPIFTGKYYRGSYCASEYDIIDRLQYRGWDVFKVGYVDDLLVAKAKHEMGGKYWLDVDDCTGEIVNVTPANHRYRFRNLVEDLREIF